MPSYKTKAIVLKSYNLGEADKILKLFSKENGLIDAVAKSARKIKSRFGGRLELFNFLELELSKGRSLDIVNQAELVKNFSDIPKDFNRFLFSQYICEIILKTHFSETEITPVIFKLIYVCLNAINSAPEGNLNKVKQIAVFFIAKFLKITGYPPLISSCCVCGKDIKLALRQDFAEPYIQENLSDDSIHISGKTKKHSVQEDSVFNKENSFYFSIRLGGALCKNCEPKIQNSPDIKKKLDSENYRLLKTLFDLNMKNCLKTEINDARLNEVFKIIEEYLKYHYDLNINTGTYLKNILG